MILDDLTVSSTAVSTQRGRTTRRTLIGGGIALVAALLGLCAVQLHSADQHARAGLDQLSGVESSIPTDLGEFVEQDTADVVDQLRSASADFSDAADAAGSAAVAPLRWLPVIGRQIRAIDALAEAATATTSASADALESLAGVAEEPPAEPAGRLESVRSIERDLSTLRDRLDAVDLGPSTALVGPVADARQEFAERLDELQIAVGDAAVAVAGVEDFLTGPNRYLVLAANNAEMRAGSGMFLQVGEMTITNGQFELGELTPAGELVSAELSAEVDADIQALWGPLDPGREWRNVNLSPRFDQSARMAAELWSASGRGEVDGVLMIDVVGLQRLLQAVGPVDVDGVEGVTTVDSESILRTLLLDQYADFGDERDLRRDQLGRVAAATFDAFNTRPISSEALLSSMYDASEGRNLLLWSSDPDQEAAWQALGAAGGLSQDSMLLAVLNRGGNKLDPFLEVSSDITQRSTAGERRIDVTVTITNGAPPDLPPYVAGSDSRFDTRPGEYRGIVSLTVPGGAGDFVADPGPIVVAGADGATRVVATDVDLMPRESMTTTFSFLLPDRWRSITVLPSARVPPISWTAGADRWTDDRPRTVQVDEL